MAVTKRSPFARPGCAIAALAASFSWAMTARADAPELERDQLAWSDVYICSEIRLDGACDKRAAVSIDAAASPAPRSPEAAQQQRVAASLERGPDTSEREVLLENGRAPMENGLEVDPSLKWQVRHEFMLILAEALDRPELRGFVARYQMKPDVEQLRGMRATYELERQRRRGMYTEFEEELGSERVSGMTTGAFLTGATLFTAGAAISATVDSAPDNTPHAKIRPKFGTPGIKLKGQFDFF